MPPEILAAQNGWFQAGRAVTRPRHPRRSLQGSEGTLRSGCPTARARCNLRFLLIPHSPAPSLGEQSRGPILPGAMAHAMHWVQCSCAWAKSRLCSTT